MSEVYSLEPPTSGKVILHTTHGEIDIELFSKECPLACRAFVQLCASKYYEQNIFHRIVKGFMVQTGDKTGTGKGNGWKEGEKFKDEFHSRISFNARGQVAMANEGKRNSNGSQFFITVDKCRHLDRKHTIFGKVANQTFYNVQRIAECECEGETPVGEPLPRIVRTEVVWNPFADIVVAVPEEKSEEKKEQPKAKKKKQKANVGLLSFGDDEEVVEDEDERKEKKAKKQKIASAHDVVEEGSNKKFAKVDDEEYGNVLKKTEEETRENEKKAKDLEEKMKAKMREKREKVSGNGGEKSSLAMLSEMNVHISEEERKRIEKAKKAREKQAKAERKLERERHKKNKLKKLGLGKALVTEEIKRSCPTTKSNAPRRNCGIEESWIARKIRWLNYKSSTKSYTKEEKTKTQKAIRKHAMVSSASPNSSRKVCTTWKTSTKTATKYAKTTIQTTTIKIGERTRYNSTKMAVKVPQPRIT